MFNRRFLSKRLFQFAIIAGLCLGIAGTLFGCQTETFDNPGLMKSTYFELVDWHISGLWVINSPVAWVRITNYNTVPIKDIVLKYSTYDEEGHLLNEGDYVIEETVPPGSV